MYHKELSCSLAFCSVCRHAGYALFQPYSAFDASGHVCLCLPMFRQWWRALPAGGPGACINAAVSPKRYMYQVVVPRAYAAQLLGCRLSLIRAAAPNHLQVRLTRNSFLKKVLLSGGLGTCYSAMGRTLYGRLQQGTQ
jgi:hypothetical protein